MRATTLGCLFLLASFVTVDDAVAQPQGVSITSVPVRASLSDRRLRRRFRLEVEVGPVWQTRNEVASPGDTGTRFDLDELTGAGPFPYGRVTFDWQINRRHSVRALVAPLEIDERGTLTTPVSFEGTTFAPGVSTRGVYRFNSYRLTYRYRLWCGRDWDVHVGATAKIRDAKIELAQGALSERKTDLGFVPLLHVDAQWRFAPRWRASIDIDGLAAPQGRAFDVAIKAYYDLNRQTSIGFGYRTIEGGADNDTVFTFAWLHQAVLSLEFRF